MKQSRYKFIGKLENSIHNFWYFLDLTLAKVLWCVFSTIHVNMLNLCTAPEQGHGGVFCQHSPAFSTRKNFIRSEKFISENTRLIWNYFNGFNPGVSDRASNEGLNEGS